MIDTHDRGDARESYEAAAANVSTSKLEGHVYNPRRGEDRKTTSEKTNDRLIDAYSRFPECKRWIDEGYDDISNYKTDDKEAKDLVRKNKAEGIDTKIWPIALTPNGNPRGEGYVGVFKKRA